MSDHIKVEESYVEALINNAAWDAARVSLVEKKDDGESKGDKGKDKKDPKAKDYTDGGDRKGDEGAGKKKGDKPDFTTGARKGDKGAGKDKDDKPDFTTDQRKGDKSKTHPGKKDFEESVEEHVCPLCESTLEEALTDDQIMEHVAQIQAAIQSIEEGGDEDDRPASEHDDVEPTPDDLDKIEASKKRKKVEAKVKELKASAKK